MHTVAVIVFHSVRSSSTADKSVRRGGNEKILQSRLFNYEEDQGDMSILHPAT